GYGATDDAFHVTQPAPGGAGAEKAMNRAIEDAELTITDIQYINAHGTSTPFNDKNESAAIKSLFGSHPIKVSSTKSMTGHLLGAAGGIEAVATVKSILEQMAPPTINQETTDPECELDYIPNQSQSFTINAALSNTFGFGGHNAVICLKKYSG
ncbi:MAG: beta-ketoacyl-[acyl-carrier-protein] synthase II, partial [Candidatus Marinimicrobia bacterium]|nr:beta-ketoacyl-[acyl-carrier-protein] synthase II [Candidatus Neomarinimicrobiota bacterium]